MRLLPSAIRKTLRANAGQETDHPPVVKLFAPTGAACWLFTELASDGDTLFGLADLGFGCPEIGYASLAEIAAVRLPLGLRIERDGLFEATHPLSVYTEAARMRGHITQQTAHLTQAAAALAARKTRSPPSSPAVNAPRTACPCQRGNPGPALRSHVPRPEGGVNHFFHSS